MRCKYCNAEIKDGLKFCTQCGQNLVTAEKETKMKESKTEDENTKTNKMYKTILAFVAAFLIVGLFIGTGKKESSFKFNNDHIKFLKTMGIDSIGTIYDDADGSKNFIYNGNQIYVYLDKNNGIKAVKFGDNKEVLWDDVYGKKKSLPKKKVAKQKETLEDVKKWYISQIPRINLVVEAGLMKSDCSDPEVISNKFYFGRNDGWYDCHYTVWFRANIKGIPVKYEMRIFLKYKDDLRNMKMWSCSGFEVSTGVRVFRKYDEAYEKIIEDYYKYLVKNYS